MKRFTETNKWDDPWFRKLSPVAKLLWSYLTDKCDCIGLIDLDSDSAAFHIGSKVEERHISELESRLQRLKNGKIFIPKFILFQYGKLSVECRAHIPVLKAIEFHQLTTDGIAYQYPIDRLCIGLAQPSKTGKGQDMDRTVQGGTGGTALKSSRPTLEEVKLVGSKTGLPETDAIWFWNKCEGNGWTNGGKSIKSWPHVIAAWKAAGYFPSQKNKPTTNGVEPDSFWKLSKELELVEVELKKINERASQTALNKIIQTEDRESYDRLRNRRSEIKTKLQLK